MQKTSGQDIIFLGNNEHALSALLNCNVNILAVVHERDHDLEFSHSYDQEIIAKNGKVISVEKNCRGDLEKNLAQLPPADLLVVSYFSILSAWSLNLARLGCLNIHPSLLPEYKGPHPIKWCLINGEKTTGVTFMSLVPQIDAGGIYHQEKCEITDEDDALTLFDKLNNLVQKALSPVMDKILSGQLQARPQTGPGSYFPKLSGDIRYINFKKMTARDIHNLTRSQVKYGGSLATWNQKRLAFGRSAILEENSQNDRPGQIIAIRKKNTTSCFEVICRKGTVELYYDAEDPKAAQVPQGDWLGT
ncbi:MAG: hypothetical protein JW860_06225 [Sedimentisphaerales bacterium]|nr:hypothetical protein [Sedimentisphaerales bacterium]